MVDQPILYSLGARAALWLGRLIMFVFVKARRDLKSIVVICLRNMRVNQERDIHALSVVD